MANIASNTDIGNFPNRDEIIAAARAMASSQLLIDEFENGIDRLAANFEQNGGDELIQMARKLAQTLPTGMLGKLHEVIDRVSDNKVNQSFQSFWEDLKSEIKKEENQKFVMADFAGDVAQNAQQNAINQNDYSKTYTNDQLDQMEWVGDENEIWEVLGKKASRRQHYEAMKQTRNDLEKIAIENNWSAQKKADEDKLLQNAMQAFINKDYAKMQEFTSKMDSKTKEQFEKNLKLENGNSQNAEIVETASKTAVTYEQIKAQNLVLGAGAEQKTENIVELATGGNIRGSSLKDKYNPVATGEVNVVPLVTNENKIDNKIVAQNSQSNALNKEFDFS